MSARQPWEEIRAYAAARLRLHAAVGLRFASASRPWRSPRALRFRGGSFADGRRDRGSEPAVPGSRKAAARSTRDRRKHAFLTLPALGRGARVSLHRVDPRFVLPHAVWRAVVMGGLQEWRAGLV